MVQSIARARLATGMAAQVQRLPDLPPLLSRADDSDDMDDVGDRVLADRTGLAIGDSVRGIIARGGGEG